MHPRSVTEVSLHIHRRLPAWFDRRKRDLPWRKSRNAYRVWLSEIMLQQTQVATVIPYYKRFLQRFPTIEALARAPLDEVLRLWAGLGYYARARNLHRAANVISFQYKGKWPRTAAELQKLPGVGRYTAGAIASIAFGRREAVVDANVARVLARLHDFREDVASPSGHAAIWRLATELLPLKRCGDFNESLMELGATVCLPGPSARCSACPLKGDCKALASGTVATLPVKSAKAKVRKETHVVLAIQRGRRWLVSKRPEKGLWGGLWELPSDVVNGQTPRALASEIAGRHLPNRCTFQDKPFCKLRHQLSHRSITLVGYRCRIAKMECGRTGNHSRTTGGTPVPQQRWLGLEEMHSLGLSRAMNNVLAALRSQVE